jgi:hypothetical protein
MICLHVLRIAVFNEKSFINKQPNVLILSDTFALFNMHFMAKMKDFSPFRSWLLANKKSPPNAQGAFH